MSMSKQLGFRDVHGRNVFNASLFCSHITVYMFGEEQTHGSRFSTVWEGVLSKSQGSDQVPR